MSRFYPEREVHDQGVTTVAREDVGNVTVNSFGTEIETVGYVCPPQPEAKLKEVATIAGCDIRVGKVTVVDLGEGLEAVGATSVAVVTRLASLGAVERMLLPSSEEGVLLPGHVRRVQRFGAQLLARTVGEGVVIDYQN